MERFSDRGLLRFDLDDLLGLGDLDVYNGLFLVYVFRGLVVGLDYDLGAVGDLAAQDHLAHRVFDHALQHTLQGTRAEGCEVEDLNFAYALYAGDPSNGSSTTRVASFREGRIGYRLWATRRGRINPSVEDRLDHDVEELMA